VCRQAGVQSTAMCVRQGVNVWKWGAQVVRWQAWVAARGGSAVVWRVCGIPAGLPGPLACLSVPKVRTMLIQSSLPGVHTERYVGALGDV